MNGKAGPRARHSGTLPPPLFVGGHLALDFLNTVVDTPELKCEWLVDGEAMLGWLAQSGAIDGEIAAHYQSRRVSAASLDELARQARELREWFRGFVHKHAGRAMTSTALEELDRLNRLAASDSRYRQIGKATGVRDKKQTHSLQVVEQRRWDTPDRLLQPLIEAMIDLVCNVDFKLIRTCEGSNCTLMFHDITRGHARRWCSMAACGNRHKAAAHRARQRQS